MNFLNSDKRIREAVEKIKEKSLFSYFYLKQFVYIPDLSVATMGVINGKLEIHYSPQFVEGLKSETLQTVLMHELSHSILMHFERKGNRDDFIWNIATDGVINQDLINKGWELDIQGTISGKRFENKSAEQVYAELVKNMPQIKSDFSNSRTVDNHDFNNSQNSPSSVFVKGDNKIKTDSGDGSQSQKKQEIEKAEEKIREAVRKAIKKAEEEKEKGSTSNSKEYGLSGREPDIVREYVMKASSVRYNFKGMLQDEVFKALGEDADWRFPHIISDSVGEYLPSLNGRKKNVAIVIDTSGSISNDKAQKFVDVVRSILSRRSDAEGFLLEADDNLLSCEKLSFRKEIKIRRGNGGTDFEPAIKYIVEKRLNPKIVLYLTDGRGSLPRTRFSFPLVWILSEEDADITTKKVLSKFGKVMTFPYEQGEN